jgi:hypothetical protein
MASYNYKEFFMALRTIGILYLFYLQYTNMVSIPLSVILMITIGSFGLSIFCNKSTNTSQVINHKLYNYALSLAGLVILVKQFMV